MATLTDIQNSSPELTYLAPQSFIMVIDRLPTLQYNVQQVNIPTISVGEASWNTAANINFMPGTTTDYTPFDATFLFDKEAKAYGEILKWMKSTSNADTEESYIDFIKSIKDRGTNINDYRTDTTNSFQDLFSDVRVSATDGGGNVITTWTFRNCYPISLDGPQFDFGRQDVDYLTSTVSFRYHYFNFQAGSDAEI